MKVSYEGIGAWSATFETADAREGQVVKLSAPRTVSPCAAGDAFCGVAGPVRGGVCGVQLGGLAEVSYTGTVPGVGNIGLTADGSGGVCVAESGAEYWVLAVDESAGRCVIKL